MDTAYTRPFSIIKNEQQSKCYDFIFKGFCVVHAITLQIDAFFKQINLQLFKF